MSRNGFKALNSSLVLLVLCIGIAAALWVFSSRQADKARIEMERVQYTLNATRTRLLKTGSERNLIDQNFDAWQNLVRHGITRDDQRLVWLESITNANRSNRLYGLDYRLDAPANSPAGLSRSLPLMQTAIHIKMPILVEDDLSRFLDQVHDSGNGMMRVKSCTLTRIGPVSPAMVDQPGLEAECELLWYTLKAGS